MAASIRSISVASIPIPIIFVDMTLPKPSGEFEWVQASWGAALRCRPLFEIARHCVTSTDLKLEGVRGECGVGWSQLARSLGVEPTELIRLRQVHGTRVFEAQKKIDLNVPF